MRFARARAVADAVLFEGYLLYPYRASAPKNRLRWQFGVLAPQGAGAGEPWWMETQCPLAPGEAARLDIKLRFLRLQRRQVEVAVAGGGFSPVEELEVDRQPVLSFDEAEVEEVDFTLGDLSCGARISHVCPFALAATRREELLPGGAGRVVRQRQAVAGLIRVTLAAAPPLAILTVRVENTGDPAADPLPVSFLGTHLLLAATGADFVSVLDPPPWAGAAAASCRSTRTFPVLAGPAGTTDLLLSAPIILYDHPAVAPESPGDLFDATEIDEILTLRTLALTDEEKRQARATDPRAAAIIDRTEAMPEAMWERLHGAIRSLRPVGGPPAQIQVGGLAVGAGARVRLRPGVRRTDAQDMFLAGMVATVQAVMADVDGKDCLAVTVDDDPASPLFQMHGRCLYFYPDEVEPLPAGDGGP
jgi:hypothetical protein